MAAGDVRRRVAAVLPAWVRRPLRWSVDWCGSVLQAGAQPLRSLARCFDSNLRRIERWRHRRVVVATITAALLVVAAFVVGVVTGNWVAAVVVVLLFVVEAVVLAWRARPARGRARHWPVGDLRPGPDALSRMDHFSSRAACYGPIFKTGFLGTPTCCVVDLEQGRKLMREHADALGPAWGPYERFVPGGSVRGAEASRNAPLRRTYAHALTAALVHSWEPAFARLTSSALDAMADAADAVSGVEPRPRVRALVLAAWTEVLFGIADDEPAFAEAAVLVGELDPQRHSYDRPLPDDIVVAKLERLATLVRHATTTRDRSEVPTTLADRFEELQPGALADPGMMRNLLYTLITTRDDVAGLLLWVLWYVTDQPAWLDRIRDDPRDAVAVADRIVSETLRLEQSEFVMRRAYTDIRFGEVLIPEGWFVRVCIREIHRDPATIAHALTFDPDRFLHDDARRVYAPFGIDHHFCLGEVLTRTMARVFVLALADGFEPTARRDGPPELSRQRHWSPSSRWLVVLQRRRAPVSS